MSMLPADISSLAEGVVVPMPTLPVASITNFESEILVPIFNLSESLLSIFAYQSIAPLTVHCNIGLPPLDPPEAIFNLALETVFVLSVFAKEKIFVAPIFAFVTSNIPPGPAVPMPTLPVFA